MRRHSVVAVIVAVGIAALAAGSGEGRGYTFGLIAKIPLPGTGGHGDWVTYDPVTNAVYVALHKSGVAVINAEAQEVWADVEPIAGPNGIAYSPRYVYAAAGDSNELVVVSKASWKIVDRVKTKGKSPNGVWVDLGRGEVLVASDDDNWIEVYNGGAYPRLRRVIPLLPTKPKSGPDVGTLVAGRGLFMPDDALVERVDLTRGKVLSWVDTHVRLTKLGGTKNMIYDPVRNHLWVGTTGKWVLVLDARTLHVVGRAPTHGGTDEVAFDPGLRLVYTFEGQAKGFDAFNADTLAQVAYVNTGSGNTHTGTVNPVTHYVYAYEGDANVVGVYSPFGAH